MIKAALDNWTQLLLDNQRLDDAELRKLAGCDDLPALMFAASTLRDHAHRDCISVSRKIFIPLTQL